MIFETLNGCRVVLADINKAGLPPAIEAGSTVREVVWGVADTADLALYSQRIANDPGFIEQRSPSPRDMITQWPGHPPASNPQA